MIYLKNKKLIYRANNFKEGLTQMKKLFYNSKEVQSMLSLGCIRTAQIRIKSMNDELKEKGYWVERGKVPIAFFHEKYPYIEKEND